jgi:LPS export ABC transporter protein LptC
MRSSFTRLLKYTAACLLGCFFVVSCENDVKKIDALLSKKTGLEEGKDIESYLSQDGLLKARLRSPYMLRYLVDTPYLEFPRKLHVDFYNDSTKIESTLDAMYARYRENQRIVYLKDSIVVINILQGDTLKTDELWWDQNKQQFYTERDVEIRKPTQTIFGKGLTAKQNFSEYTIFKINGIVQTGPNGIPE